MEKYKYDEGNGLWYELQGDYYIPCLKLSDENQVTIGIWGQRHLNYLRENKRVLLSGLQLSGKLNSYLADIDKQAEEMCSRLVKQMADREDITEQLKAENQMEWGDHPKICVNLRCGVEWQRCGEIPGQE